MRLVQTRYLGRSRRSPAARASSRPPAPAFQCAAVTSTVYAKQSAPAELALKRHAWRWPMNARRTSFTPEKNTGTARQSGRPASAGARYRKAPEIVPAASTAASAQALLSLIFVCSTSPSFLRGPERSRSSRSVLLSSRSSEQNRKCDCILARDFDHLQIKITNAVGRHRKADLRQPSSSAPRPPRLYS